MCAPLRQNRTNTQKRFLASPVYMQPRWHSFACLPAGLPGCLRRPCCDDPRCRLPAMLGAALLPAALLLAPLWTPSCLRRLCCLPPACLPAGLQGCLRQPLLQGCRLSATTLLPAGCLQRPLQPLPTMLQRPGLLTGCLPLCQPCYNDVACWVAAPAACGRRPPTADRRPPPTADRRPPTADRRPPPAADPHRTTRIYL